MSMLRIAKLCVTAAALFALAAGSASARKVALVIGNGAYSGSPALAHLSRDAARLADTLEANGFEVGRALDADRFQFETELKAFFRSMRGADVALFYFAGHAMQSTGRNYLLPTDAVVNDLADLEFEAVDLDAILRQMRRERRANIVFVDAARENPFADRLGGGPGAAVNGSGKGLARPKSAPDTLFAFATAPDRTAPDGSGGSYFTQALIEALDRPGQDIETIVKTVQETAKRRSSGKASPWISSSLAGRVVVTTPSVAGGQGTAGQGGGAAGNDAGDGNTPPTLDGPGAGGSPSGADTGRSPTGPGAGAAEIAFWNTVKDSRDPEDFRSYLKRFPTGLFADLARRRIERYSSAGGSTNGGGHTTSSGGNTPSISKTPPPPPRGTVILKVASVYPKRVPEFGTQITRLASRLETTSKRHIRLTVFDPGQVVGAYATFDAVKAGTVDAGWVTLQYWSGKQPAYHVLAGTIPFGRGPESLLNWLLTEGQALRDDLLLRQNIKALPCGIVGLEGGGWFRKPIRRADDLKGLKIRAAGLAGSIYEKLGSVPVALPGSDIYPALEKGVIDAAEFSTPLVDLAFDMSGAAKVYYYPGWHQPATVIDLLINRGTWNRLEPAAKNFLVHACRRALADAVDDAPANERKGIDGIRAKGAKVVPFPTEVLAAFRRASDDALRDLSGRSRDFRRVYESYRRN